MRRAYSFTCTGLAKPVVSERPTSSHPAATSFSAMSSTLRQRHHAFQGAAEGGGQGTRLRSCGRSSSGKLIDTFTNATRAPPAASGHGYRLTFFRLWVSLTDRGMVILCGRTARASLHAAQVRHQYRNDQAPRSVPRAKRPLRRIGHLRQHARRHK